MQAVRVRPVGIRCAFGVALAAYALVGVPGPKALAAAISLFAVMLVLAASGGLLNLVRPLKG